MIAIDYQRRLEALDSADRSLRRAVPAVSCSCVHQPRGPVVQLIRIRIFQAVLVLRPADPVFDRQVLHRLHVESDSIDLVELWLQAADHVDAADACAHSAA